MVCLSKFVPVLLEANKIPLSLPKFTTLTSLSVQKSSVNCFISLLIRLYLNKSIFPLTIALSIMLFLSQISKLVIDLSLSGRALEYKVSSVFTLMIFKIEASFSLYIIAR